MLKIAFLTEMGFGGKIPPNHPNMRTEFSWMFSLNADHFPIGNFRGVQGYDHIFVIFPKGRVYLDACGSQIAEDKNPVSELLSLDLVGSLKATNKKVHFIQEGPHWLWNDYNLADQVNYYNMLASFDTIFTHNEYDVKYYKGMYPNTPVYSIPTLLIEDQISKIDSEKEDKVIIGGNFARWYGGMESFNVAQRFEVPIWGQTSHAMRPGEDQLFNHLPRVVWLDWMRQLSSFKYAVHLMPTVAAGTFSLNCAYFGIPCIGNEKVDTQRICHPSLSVDVADIEKAGELAYRLANDEQFYKQCSDEAKALYQQNYKEKLFKQKINTILEV